MSPHSRVIVATETPWDLRGRGMKDSARHDKRIQDAIKKNLKDMISREDIIVSDGTKRVRIPIRYLEQYHFKYGDPGGGVGQGAGKAGDVLSQPGQPGDGQDGAGDSPGEHNYEVEVDLETLTRMMLEELSLPWLEEKPAAKKILQDTYDYTDRRKRGIMAHLDKRRTMRENILRNAARGDPRIHDIHDADLRFRVPDIHHETSSNAAVYLLMDASGSMTSEKKVIAKCLSFWIVRFLRMKYQQVEIVFIVHDTEAEIVKESEFFALSASGGTKCSSAYTVALRHITEHFSPALYNIYLLHFSDGDNFSDDNPTCLTRLGELLQICTMCGYAEIFWNYGYSLQASTLKTLYAQIQHANFVATVLRSKDDIQAALKAFLGADITTKSAS